MLSLHIKMVNQAAEDPYLEGRERLKKEADPCRLVVAGLISKGTCLPGLSWVVAG